MQLSLRHLSSETQIMAEKQIEVKFILNTEGKEEVFIIIFNIESYFKMNKILS